MFTSNFTKPKCTNLGSIRSFRFVPEQLVESMDINELDSILTDITLIGAAVWNKGYSTVERINVDQEEDDTDNGPVYKPTFTGFFPGYNYLIEKIFARMAATGRYVVDVIDNNNERFVLGRKGNGMRFTWKHSTGTAPRGLNGYIFRFAQESAFPKLRYNEGAAIPVPDVL